MPGILRDWIRFNRSLVICVALLASLMLIGGMAITGFLSAANLQSMLLLASFLGFAALGQTLCALVGGIDLSIGFVIGAANILLPFLFNLGVPPVIATAIVLAVGAGVGIVNGLLSFRMQGQSLIMTLGVGFAAAGAAQIVTTYDSIYAGNVLADIPDWLTRVSSLSGGVTSLRIPLIVVLWAIVTAAVIFVMTRTWFGRSVYALGGNRTAARLLLISEFRGWISVYAISGLMAAATGIFLLGFSGGGFVGVGDPYLFMTVASVVMGGTSLLGGTGGYGATVVGVLVLTVLTSLLVGLGLSYAAQQIIFGMLIVPLVAIYARSPDIRMQI